MPDREQTFLIGPTLYLRPVLLADAATAAIWRKSPFPAPAATVEEELKKQLAVSFPVQQANTLLIVCWRESDHVVGSATVNFVPHRSASFEWMIDPLMPAGNRRQVAAELLEILVSWLLGECRLKWVSLIAIDDASLPSDTIPKIQGRLAYRLREAHFLNGVRPDRIAHQFFNPVWIEHLGPPPPVVQGSVERPQPMPQVKPDQRSPGESPRDALSIGARTYLRAFDPSESEMVAETWLQEPEHYLPGGRTLGNPYTFGHVHTSIARVEPPNWIRFGVALRETGKLIGSSGLRDVDWINRTAETQSQIFRPEHRNLGLGTEIKHLLLEYAFNRLGMHMIWARVEEGNDRSAAELRKQAYRDAGYIAWSQLNEQGMGGDWFFDLLGSEWRNEPRSSYQ